MQRESTALFHPSRPPHWSHNRQRGSVQQGQARACAPPAIAPVARLTTAPPRPNPATRRARPIHTVDRRGQKVVVLPRNAGRLVTSPNVTLSALRFPLELSPKRVYHRQYAVAIAVE